MHRHPFSSSSSNNKKKKKGKNDEETVNNSSSSLPQGTGSSTKNGRVVVVAPTTELLPQVLRFSSSSLPPSSSDALRSATLASSSSPQSKTSVSVQRGGRDRGRRSRDSYVSLSHRDPSSRIHRETGRSDIEDSSPQRSRLPLGTRNSLRQSSGMLVSDTSPQRTTFSSDVSDTSPFPLPHDFFSSSSDKRVVHAFMGATEKTEEGLYPTAQHVCLAEERSPPCGKSSFLVGENVAPRNIRVVVRLLPPLKFTAKAYVSYKVQPAPVVRGTAATTSNPSGATGERSNLRASTGWPSYLSPPTAHYTLGAPLPLSDPLSHGDPPCGSSPSSSTSVSSSSSMVQEESQPSGTDPLQSQRRLPLPTANSSTPRQEKGRRGKGGPSPDFLPLFGRSPSPLRTSSEASRSGCKTSSAASTLEPPRLDPSRSPSHSSFPPPPLSSATSMASPNGDPAQGGEEYFTSPSLSAVGGTTYAEGGDGGGLLRSASAALVSPESSTPPAGTTVGTTLSMDNALSAVPPSVVLLVASPSATQQRTLSFTAAFHESSGGEKGEEDGGGRGGGGEGGKSRSMLSANPILSSSSSSGGSTPFVVHGVLESSPLSSEGAGGGDGNEAKHFHRMLVRPLVRRAQNGRSTTIVLCGQSGTGKTHTLKQLSLTLSHTILSYVDESEGDLLEMSYVQLIGDRAFHLLGPSSCMVDQWGIPLPPPPPSVNASCGMEKEQGTGWCWPHSGASVTAAVGAQDACLMPRVIIRSASDIQTMLEQAEELKYVRSQEFNARSSGSHCIFALTWTRCWKGTPLLSSSIIIVDVAANPVEPGDHHQREALPCPSSPHVCRPISGSDGLSSSTTSERGRSAPATSATATLRCLIGMLGYSEQQDVHGHFSPSSQRLHPTTCLSPSMALLSLYLTLIWRPPFTHWTHSSPPTRAKNTRYETASVKDGDRVQKGKRNKKTSPVEKEEEEEEEEENEEEAMMTLFLLSVSLAVAHYPDTFHFLELGEKLCHRRQSGVSSPTSSASSFTPVVTALPSDARPYSPVTSTSPQPLRHPLVPSVVVPHHTIGAPVAEGTDEEAGDRLSHSEGRASRLRRGSMTSSRGLQRSVSHRLNETTSPLRREGVTSPVTPAMETDRFPDGVVETGDRRQSASGVLSPRQRRDDSSRRPSSLPLELAHRRHSESVFSSLSSSRLSDRRFAGLPDSRPSTACMSDDACSSAAPEMVHGTIERRRNRSWKAHSNPLDGEEAEKRKESGAVRSVVAKSHHAKDHRSVVHRGTQKESPCTALSSHFQSLAAPGNGFWNAEREAAYTKEMEEMQWTRTTLEKEMEMTRHMLVLEKQLQETAPPFFPSSTTTARVVECRPSASANDIAHGRERRPLARKEEEKEVEKDETDGGMVTGLPRDTQRYETSSTREEMLFAKEGGKKKNHEAKKESQKEEKRNFFMWPSPRVAALEKEEAMLSSANRFVEKKILYAAHQRQSFMKGQERCTHRRQKSPSVEQGIPSVIPSGMPSSFSTPLRSLPPQREAKDLPKAYGVEKVCQGESVGVARGQPSRRMGSEDDCGSHHPGRASDEVRIERPSPSPPSMAGDRLCLASSPLEREGVAASSSSPLCGTMSPLGYPTGAPEEQNGSLRLPPPAGLGTAERDGYPYASAVASVWTDPKLHSSDAQSHTGTGSLSPPSWTPLEERRALHAFLQEMQLLLPSLQKYTVPSPSGDVLLGAEKTDTDVPPLRPYSSSRMGSLLFRWKSLVHYLHRCEALLLSSEEHVNVLNHRLEVSHRERQKQFSVRLKEKEQQVQLQKMLCDFCTQMEEEYDERSQWMEDLEELQLALYRERAAKAIAEQTITVLQTMQQRDSRGVEELTKKLETQQKSIFALQARLEKVEAERNKYLLQKDSLEKKQEETQECWRKVLAVVSPEEKSKWLDYWTPAESSFVSSYSSTVSPSSALPFLATSLAPSSSPTKFRRVVPSTTIVSSNVMRNTNSNAREYRASHVDNAVPEGAAISSNPSTSFLPLPEPSPHLSAEGMTDTVSHRERTERETDDKDAQMSPLSHLPSTAHSSLNGTTGPIQTATSTGDICSTLERKFSSKSSGSLAMTPFDAPPSEQNQHEREAANPHTFYCSPSSQCISSVPFLSPLSDGNLSLATETVCALRSELSKVPTATTLPTEGNDFSKPCSSFPTSLQNVEKNAVGVASPSGVDPLVKTKGKSLSDSNSTALRENSFEEQEKRKNVTVPSLQAFSSTVTPASFPAFTLAENRELQMWSRKNSMTERQLPTNHEIAVELEGVIDNLKEKIATLSTVQSMMAKKYHQSRKENVQLIEYERILENHIVEEKVNTYRQVKKVSVLNGRVENLVQENGALKAELGSRDHEIDRLTSLVDSLRRLLDDEHRKVDQLLQRIKQINRERAQQNFLCQQFYKKKIQELEERLSTRQVLSEPAKRQGRVLLQQPSKRNNFGGGDNNRSEEGKSYFLTQRGATGN